MRVDPKEEFSELLGIERWQRLQTHFCRALGFPLRTLSPARTLLTEPSWPAGLDIQQVTEQFRLGEELADLLPEEAPLKQTAVTSRPLGVSFAAIPMRATADRILAYLIVGPVVLGARERLEAFRRRVEAMGLNPEPIWSALLTIKLYSHSAFKSVLAFLEEAGNTLLELAFQSRQIKAIVPEAGRVDQLVLKHYAQRLCHSLLEVAATATRAEGGSVMLFEEASGAYRIAAAQGLTDELAQSTRLPVGQGIAGLAAERGQILLLDAQVQDPVLRERMQRPRLASSLVAPIMVESSRQVPLGVLNLRTTRSESPFTQKDADFVRKLMELAHTAFSGIAPARP